MHTGRVYTVVQVAKWTRYETMVFVVIAAIPTALHELAGFTFLSLPWLPVALIGTAVAFLVGFKNNASYDRLWEARKIWSAIVNTSRTFTADVIGFVVDPPSTSSFGTVDVKGAQKRLVYRHIAWLTALRFQLRERRDWESITTTATREYMEMLKVPEQHENLEEELAKFIGDAELARVLNAPNRATQLLLEQTNDIKHLTASGCINSYQQVELANVIEQLYDHQGKCERIKNFPYPRQFATINQYFVWTFIVLVPFGLLDEFKTYGPLYTWLTIPFSALVAWVFHTMEKIGSATENPFEGTANDVPISALSRTIEIDLRSMLGETDLPKPREATMNILF